MKLFRLHAYSVDPQRTLDDESEPDGGAVTINAQLRNVVEENTRRARFNQRTAVDLNVDPTTRTNEVRNSIMHYAFGEPPTAKAAAVTLAGNLSKAMDLRSTHALFILAASRNGAKRRVTVWTFPRDRAFQFSTGRTGPHIRILTDVFSQTSKLRKAALFEGVNKRTDFLRGRVLDFQADNLSRAVADFWISRFLDSRLAVGDDSGTRILARTLQKAFDACDAPDDLEQLYVAGMQMRRSPHKRISLAAFAHRYLGDDAKVAFLAAVPTDQALTSMFDFQHDVFDATINFRIYSLETGVIVSSPLTEVGESVTVSGTGKRQLKCQGTIVAEKLRTRHGR